MKNSSCFFRRFNLLLLLFILFFSACKKDKEKDDLEVDGIPSSLIPDVDNGTLKVPGGFGAITVSAATGRARHIAVNSKGDVFIKLSELKNGKGILVLKDSTGDGRADIETGFGNFTGTGIAIKNGYLYASSETGIFRYQLSSNGEVENSDAPESIVTGLFAVNQHSSKSFTLDNQNNIYVNIGAPSNACQVQDRATGSPGINPCPQLANAAGIWRFSATQLNQTQSQGLRYATGIRNVVGLDWNTNTNELYVMQHGRDQLSTLFPQFYSDSQNAELPSEELLRVNEGDNFGWPYCYYDHIKKQKLLAPEYGGNGITVGSCSSAELPILGFPGHWAPNGLLFYTGSQFPNRYKNGAFIAFHGSWNRAPLRQGGYFVVFVPMKNGLPTGPYEIFADGFTGTTQPFTDTNDAKYRPMGLAQGPDGSLFIADSRHGRVWRIVYTGK